MLTKKGYVLQKSKLSPEDITKIKQDLIVSPLNSFTPFPEKFQVYRETDKVIRVPRFYGIEKFGAPSVNKIPEGISINTSFQGTLKPELKQDIAVDKCISDLETYGGGVLCLPTGFGKTTTALHILCKMKRKALVIVNKEVLLNQWKERIQFFIPDATIGIIKQSKCDIEGKDIVLAMLQSLSLREYDLSSFGFAIIDEAHHIPSKLFSNSMFQICPKYILGLTATPFRKDGLTKILWWFMKRISFSVEREMNENVKVEIVNYSDSFDADLPFTQLVNSLTGDVTRTELIIEKIKELQKEGRKIIVLSDRREHCKEIHSRIENSGLYLGGMKQEELDYNEANCSVLLATYSLAAEGLDIPTLDTLVLATPKTDVIQAVGRILRETPGKVNEPYILDIVDTSCEKQFKKRCSFYRKYFKLLD